MTDQRIVKAATAGTVKVPAAAAPKVTGGNVTRLKAWPKSVKPTPDGKA